MNFSERNLSYLSELTFFFLQLKTFKSKIFISLVKKNSPILEPNKGSFSKWQNLALWGFTRWQIAFKNKSYLTGLSPFLDQTNSCRHHLTLQFPSTLLSVVSFDLLWKTGICFQSKSSDKPTINYWLSTYAVDKVGDKLVTIVE